MTAVVYPVRPGPNPELVYSLRSLVNLGEDVEVWTVGDLPDGVVSDHHVPGNAYVDKPRNVFSNILAVCERGDVPDEFVMFNDDFYLLAPWRPRVEYRCTLVEHIDSLTRPQHWSWWGRSLRRTLGYLRDELGYVDPLSYELHTPFVVNRDGMAETLRACAKPGSVDPPQWRTVYGNICRIGGERAERDRKLYPGSDDDPAGWPMASSTDTSFTRMEAFLAARFPTPSRWEVAANARSASQSERSAA